MSDTSMLTNSLDCFYNTYYNKNFCMQITATVIILSVCFVNINSTYVLSTYPKIVHLVEFARHRYTGLSYIRGT